MCRRAALYTLGCKVNQCETQSLSRILQESGYEIVPFGEKADLYVINTCAVTHLSARKSRQIIRRAIRTNPDAVVFVTGCYAQVNPEEIASISGVDLIVGNRERAKISQLVEKVLTEKDAAKPLILLPDLENEVEFEELPPALEQGHTRAFLKIQEGCREFCTYCIIPFSRGPIRSRRPEKVIEISRELAGAGFKEIVLTGVHLGTYGQDLGENVTLSSLLPELAKIENLGRIRLSSLEPMDLNKELLDAVSSLKKVCNHLHIPLQSGDDQVLQNMGRSYGTSEFSYMIRWLRDAIPGIAITTDIIVGFPGETRQRFENTCRFVEKTDFARLHVFKYSPRPGTSAADMKDQVSADEKEYRSKVMIRLGQKMSKNYRRKYLKSLKSVLIETQNPDSSWEGLTENYIKVRIEEGEGLSSGIIVPVRIYQERGGMLWGKIEGVY